VAGRQGQDPAVFVQRAATVTHLEICASQRHARLQVAGFIRRDPLPLGDGLDVFLILPQACREPRPKGREGSFERRSLAQRLDPVASIVQRVVARVRAAPKRVVFAEGEEEAVIRAAASFQNSGLGQAILVGREEIVRERIKRLGADTDAVLGDVIGGATRVFATMTSTRFASPFSRTTIRAMRA
jgi:hypothetical protein